MTTTIAELEKQVQELKQEMQAIRMSAGLDDPYILSEREREEIKLGLESPLATDEEMKAVFAKYGLPDLL